MLISSLVVNDSFAQSWYDKQKKCEEDISKDATPKAKLDRHNYCKKLTESYLKSHDKYGELKPPKKAQTKQDSSRGFYVGGGAYVVESRWCKDNYAGCSVMEEYTKCKNNVAKDKTLSPSMKQAKLKECEYDAGVRYPVKITPMYSKPTSEPTKSFTQKPPIPQVKLPEAKIPVLRMPSK